MSGLSKGFGRMRAATLTNGDSYAIVTARQDHLPWLAGIELAAAKMLIGLAPASVLEETTPERRLRQAAADGRLWVAVCGDVPVGFAHVESLAPGTVHLEEIDVHPAHGRRGLGTRLVTTIMDWARQAGRSEITLTTFRSVPWNMPFYSKLGFEELPEPEWLPQLRAIVADETRRGLDPSQRVVMRYRLEPAARRRSDGQMGRTQ